MDCGWQNQGEAPDNHFECERSLASSAACIRSADPPQTSGMRDVLALFAMISSRFTSTKAHGSLYGCRCGNPNALPYHVSDQAGRHPSTLRSLDH